MAPTLSPNIQNMLSQLAQRQANMQNLMQQQTGAMPYSIAPAGGIPKVQLGGNQLSQVGPSMPQTPPPQNNVPPPNIQALAQAQPLQQNTAPQYVGNTGIPTPSNLVQNLQYYLANGMLPMPTNSGATPADVGSSSVNAGGTYTPDQVASKLQGYGLAPTDANRLSGVIKQESGGNPSAIYDQRNTTGEYSVGLFQINIGSDGANLPFVEQLSGLKGLDANSTWLQDPENNTYTAAKLFQQYGYAPWKGDSAIS